MLTVFVCVFVCVGFLAVCGYVTGTHRRTFTPSDPARFFRLNGFFSAARFFLPAVSCPGFFSAERDLVPFSAEEEFLFLCLGFFLAVRRLALKSFEAPEKGLAAGASRAAVEG